MNIAIIGNGGREHAICQKLKDSKKIKNIFCIPGNAGTSEIAINLNIDFNNFKKLHKILVHNKIKLVIVGPEQPLVNGIVDFLNKKKIKVFGPNKFASQLEGSKSFVKKLCKKLNIPTASFKICRQKEDINNFIKENNLPVVIKADGLASGKGVFICKTKKQALGAANKIFLGEFKSSKKVVIEEFIDGEEASFFLIVDKKGYQVIGTAQDHKRAKEGDKGLNTGGMGAYSPAPIINEKMKEKILNRIIDPTLRELRLKKNPFTGFLYAGLMIKDNNPFLIEYNVRMGDPECQVILPRIKTDFFKIIISSIQNKINKIKINWFSEKCMTIVLCSKGYPKKIKKNIEINNLKRIQLTKNSKIFHAGTYLRNNKVFSNGGRVLNVVSKGKNFNKIRKSILLILDNINWKHGFFRKDIGWRVIKK